MTKQIRLSYAACIAAVIAIGAPTAEATQCRAAPPPILETHWTYRIIDGRKCWYEGRHMISKSLLHWPAQPQLLPVSDREPARVLRATRENPMASQARVPDDPDSFEARWRARGMEITD